jgi:tRNA threonylcarbamoyladenosine biosynthesis protein TsaB
LHVVGIDTSTFTGGIALLRDGQVVAEYSVYVTRRNSESLVAVLKDMLREIDWTPRDLQGIAVAVGPGSFTGTRIGVTMAKVLGFSLDIPISPVVTLDAIAANVAFARSLVCPVISARRDLVYNATYKADGLSPERVTEYNVSISDAARRVLVTRTSMTASWKLAAMSGMESSTPLLLEAST